MFFIGEYDLNKKEGFEQDFVIDYIYIYLDWDYYMMDNDLVLI